MTFKKDLSKLDDVSRRNFVSGAAAGLLGLGTMPLLSQFANAQAALPLGAVAHDGDDEIVLRPATAKNVIYLYMSGGMSHLDTFDLKPGSEVQGPTEAIGTNVDGIQINKLMPNMAKHMDKVCVVNSMFTTQGAHAQGRYYMHSSYAMRGTIKHPTMGAWLNRMAGKTNPTLPGHVAIGGGANTASGGFFESKYVPLPIGNPQSGLQNSKRPFHVDDETFRRRLARVEEMNRRFQKDFDQKKVRGYTDMYAEAVRLMQSQDLAAFDINKEPQELRRAYGNDQFGQGCMLARRLVEHNVRFVEVVSGGWDSHNQNFDAMGNKLPGLDRTLATLLADLEARGLLEETLVVVATEFGRTPRISEGRNGRDHYPKAFSCLLAGGGIKGGMRYGKTDAKGAEIAENPVSVPDFNATIGHALGLPLDCKIHSPSGRPFYVAHKGKPVMDLFA